MTLPISQSTIKYPVFNSALIKNRKDALKEHLSDDGFRMKILEQNERKITLSGLQVITIALGSMLLNIKLLVEIFSKQYSNRHLPALVREFESLQSNQKIPTIESCKSINNDLKTILKHQINQVKAGQNLISDSGKPQAPNRFLLYGPPGVGKSYFAKIFAKSLDAKYMEVMQSDYNSMWAGEGVDNLKKIFEQILKTAKKNSDQKYVVTFNEIDAILTSADKVSHNPKGTHWVSILEERSVFLNYLERLKEQAPNVTIIGTTNLSPKNNGLDKAAMSRFQNLTEVPYPDKNCLFEALKMSLNKLKNSDKFIKDNETQLEDLAKQMADRKFSFRNLEYIVNEAKGYNLDDRVNGELKQFNFDYLKRAYNALKISDGELENTAPAAAKI